MNDYLTNILQIALGIILILLITLPAGFAAFRLLLRITGEHPRLSWQQIPVAVALGMLIVPFALNTAGLLIDTVMRPVWVIAISVALFAALLRLAALIPTPAADPRPPLSRRDSLILLGIALAAVGVLSVLLFHNTPIPANAGSWRVIGNSDFSKHFGIISVLAFYDQLPPPNPFVVVDPVLRYYYNFYLLPASAVRLSQHVLAVSSAYAAASIITAAVFPFTLFELARRLRISTTGALITSGLATLVGGLDIIYVIAKRFELGYWMSHIDEWSPVDERRVSSISTMFIWTPQHVLGLIGFMLVLWLVVALIQPRSMRIPAIVSIAVLIASITGASIYVWIGLFAGLALFGLIEMIRTRQLPSDFIFIAVLALILSLPILILLSGRDADPFLIRIAQPPDGLRYGSVFTRLLGQHQIAYLLDFPAHSLLEFGLILVLGLAAIWTLRRDWAADPTFRLQIAFLITLTLIFVLIRDPEGRNNDFALRISPLIWITLALLVGAVWSRRSESRLWHSRLFRSIAALMLTLGLASTLYEVVIRIRELDEVTADGHEVYQWLNANLSPHDIFQHGSMGSHISLILSQRRMAAAPSYMTQIYATDPAAASAMIDQLHIGYDSTSAQESADAFDYLGITYIVADNVGHPLRSESDPDLAASFELVFENDTYRIYHVRP